MRRTLLALVLAPLLGACSDDGDTLTYAALVGRWDALAWIYVDVADPNNTVDAEQALGGQLIISIQADDRFVYFFSSGATASYEASLSGDVLVLTSSFGHLRYRVRLNGEDLTLTGLQQFVFDLDGDGTVTDADGNTEFVRDSISARRL